MKPLISFKSKFFTPYKKLITTFKFKFKLKLKLKLKLKIKTNLRFRFRKSKPKKETTRVTEIDSVSEERELMFFPAVKEGGKRISGAGDEDVEDACRSFENYLVEMIVEEGKVRDLMDVEELLYCWKNLNSPVFVDLVCRFYGELCKDLFSAADE